jgi:hypothetical protein
LQLGVITGKRRRRDIGADVSHVPNLSAEAVQQKLNEIALLERFMAQVSTRWFKYDRDKL